MGISMTLPGKLKPLPYLLLGLVIFSSNSLTNFNFWLRGYLAILEIQIGLLLLYFLLAKLAKTGRQQSLAEEGYEE